MAHYHISYPEGSSIYDNIPKDLYSLQYVGVDDAIHILHTLGTGSLMAKTDLKSAFCLLSLYTQMIGIFWIFIGSPSFTLTFIFPSG